MDVNNKMNDNNMENKPIRNMKNTVRSMWRTSHMEDSMNDGMKAGTEEAMKMKNDMMLKEEMKKAETNLQEDMKMKDAMKNHM